MLRPRRRPAFRCVVPASGAPRRRGDATAVGSARRIIIGNIYVFTRNDTGHERQREGWVDSDTFSPPRNLRDVVRELSARGQLICPR